MGSHKHGVSGRPGPSPKYKLGRTMEANEEIAKKEGRDKSRRGKGMVGSVREAFQKR